MSILKSAKELAVYQSTFFEDIGMDEISVTPESQAVEVLGRLRMEFRALPIHLLTPDLEPRTSTGFAYRRLWLHPDQGESALLTGRDIYGYLLSDQVRFVVKPTDRIRYCASLTDLWFFAQFPAYIPAGWRGKRIYGWKTCFCAGRYPEQMVVPYLECSLLGSLGEVPRIRYSYLDDSFGLGDCAAVRTDGLF